MWSEEQIKWAWQQAIAVDGYDPNMVRKDACGAWIVWDKFGQHDSPYGWEIDLVYPISHGGDDRAENIQAMQHDNHNSKKNDYPSYWASVSAMGAYNKPKRMLFVVSQETQKKLKSLYSYA